MRVEHNNKIKFEGRGYGGPFYDPGRWEIELDRLYERAKRARQVVKKRANDARFLAHS